MKQDQRAGLLFVVVAITVTTLYYWQFIGNFFSFDDFKYLENMYVGFSSVALGYGALRLVSNLSWWPLFQVSGLEPAGYNLFALFLHIANATLLFAMLLRLLGDRTIAFLAGTFFVASVAGADALLWKATNSSLFCLLFYLLALDRYIASRQTGEKKPFIAALVLFGLAMFSKEEAASFPLVIVACELIFFKGWDDKAGLMRRVAPFAAVIVGYMVLNAVVFDLIMQRQAEPARLFKLRPLYSLLGGGTVFYLGPDGFINPHHPLVYVSAAFVAVSVLFVKERRLLFFGYLWIFCAFLPQSFTGLGQFEPRNLVNSISRYLYITSIGSAVVYTAILCDLRKRMGHRWWQSLSLLCLVVFFWFNYGRVTARGNEWRQQGEPMKVFLTEIRKSIPQFPPKSYLFVNNPPAGRAFVQQGLRAFYGNPDITWIVDPATFRPKPGDTALLIDCLWQQDGNVKLDFYPLQ